MKKRALIVGINYVGTGNPLKGCLNDAKNIRTMLESKGFTDIKDVLEKEATTAGIIDGLNWLTADAQPGDVIVFHYSGHGSQLPSRVEEDGWEEIICPIDLNWTDKVITDDTLRKIFDKVPNGVNITLILDCCHSGTMLDQNQTLGNVIETKKTFKKEKGSRYLKPPAKIQKILREREMVEWETSRDVNATALLIAGCHENQTSADAIINGVPQGAATASLLNAVSADSTISYKSLVQNMQEYMVDNRFKQVPQLDGAESLYDQRFVEPFSFTIPEEPVIIDQLDTNDTDNEDDNTRKSRRNMAIIVATLAVIAFVIIMLV